MNDFIKAVEQKTKGLVSISPGLTSCCEVCRNSLDMEEDELKTALEVGDIFDEGEFGWRPCESCGSGLGGTRYIAHAFDEEKELYHLEICQDCLLFHANGDLPEQWEA